MSEFVNNFVKSNILKVGGPLLAAGVIAPPAAVAESVLVPPAAKEEAVPLDTYQHFSQLGVSMLELTRTLNRASHQKPKLNFTNYEVKGGTSTFGPPLGSVGETADQGNDARPCIALREDETLDRKFQVTVFYNHQKFQAIMPHCDWGPNIDTGRSIDITGAGVEKLHMNPYAYPNSFGIARELALPPKHK
jgi:hypothetical protein